MRHVEHHHGMGPLLDPITDTPLLAAARRVLPSVFIAKRVADSVRVIKERANHELSDCGGNLLGKTRELALRTRTHVEVPAAASVGHAAPVLRNR